MSSEHEPVSVEILDKEYLVACPADERDALVESARLLNDRLRQVRDAGKVLGTERMAVITALNIVHEMEQQKRNQVSQSAELGADLKRLEDKIKQAIGRRVETESVN